MRKLTCYAVGPIRGSPLPAELKLTLAITFSATLPPLRLISLQRRQTAASPSCPG